MEAFGTYNLRLPGIIEQAVEIPGEVIQQTRGQKNAVLSFSVVPAKNTRAYGSIFQHLNILGSPEDRKKRENLCCWAWNRLLNSVARHKECWQQSHQHSQCLPFLKVFQLYLMGLKEIEIKASKNNEEYKHFYKLVVIEGRGITHIALGYLLLVCVPSWFSLWLLSVVPLLEIIKMHIIITWFSKIHTQQVQDTYM